MSVPKLKCEPDKIFFLKVYLLLTSLTVILYGFFFLLSFK